MGRIDEAPRFAFDIDWMSIEDAAIKWNISQRQARNYCKNNWEKLCAYKKSGVWHIPVNACPPLRESDLSLFLLTVLKYQHYGMSEFPVDEIRAKWCFLALERRGYACCRERLEPMSERNLLVVEPSGWNLLFGESKHEDSRKLIIELFEAGASLINILGSVGMH